MQRITALLFALLIAAYPFAMYFGMRELSARMLGYGLMAIAIARLLVYFFTNSFVANSDRARDAQINGRTELTNSAQISKLLPAIALFLIAGLAILNDSKVALHFYPVLVNVSLLVVFGFSLYWPPTIVERMARLTEPTLDAHGVHYTRRVTQVWCVFFIANGAISSWTALIDNEKIWTLYNGFISYILMGALFAGEWLVRRRVRNSVR